jgi:hypothetical protein
MKKISFLLHVVVIPSVYLLCFIAPTPLLTMIGVVLIISSSIAIITIIMNWRKVVVAILVVVIVLVVVVVKNSIIIVTIIIIIITVFGLIMSIKPIIRITEKERRGTMMK